MYMASGNSSHLAKALTTTWGWESSSETDAVGNNPSTNNATGFSAPPAGICDGYNSHFGSYAIFWSATEHYDYSAYTRNIITFVSTVDRGPNVKSNGFSVRCVRD